MRWSIMAGVWLCCALVAAWHTRVVGDYLALLDEAGGAGAVAGATPRQQVLPARHADAQMWARQVSEAESRGEARLRFTRADNAPDGREVHWSSAFAWLLRAGVHWQRAVSVAGGEAAIERTLRWFNGPLLLAVIVGLSAWVAARAGAAGGVLAAAGLMGLPRCYEGFVPTYVDHHGLATVAVAGMLLGVLFMGGGWWSAKNGADGGWLPETAAAARRGATVSALWGAAALWLSAAAAVPAIAIMGVAGAVTGLASGRAAVAGGAVFDAEAWRRWGRVGGVVGAACYLFEYAPGHLGLRLEANHPLYAAAWWGGAEWVAALVAWRMRQDAGAGRVRLALAAAAVLAPAVTVALGGAGVFAVADPFVGALRHFVAEGMSLPAAARLHGPMAVARDVGLLFALVVALGWAWRRGGERRLVLAMAGVAIAGFALLAAGEMRWWTHVGAAELAMLIVLPVAVASERRRWGAVVVAGVLCLGGAVVRVAHEAEENRLRRVAEGDLLQPLYRDIAVALRASQSEGKIVVVANPNAAAGVSYFGDFATLGTLYWENAAGLRAAAEIFSAATDVEAERLIRARGVTHVVMLGAANFLGEYASLLRGSRNDAEARRGWGYRLLAAPDEAPAWLLPLAFRRAPGLERAGGAVALYRVVEPLEPIERLIHVARTQIARGEAARAEETFVRVLAAAPPAAHAEVCALAGEAFYEFGADAAALRFFRRAVERAFDPQVANTAAWILATSADAALRDGAAALALLRRIEPRPGDDVARCSTWAAAWAETGEFAAAVAAGERAVALARAMRDGEAEALLLKRLAAYRAGRPWRQ